MKREHSTLGRPPWKSVTPYLQIEVEDAEDGGVLLTIIDSARLSLVPAAQDGHGAAGRDRRVHEGRVSARPPSSVDVWRTADDLPLLRNARSASSGASWTCGAVRSRDVDGLADGLEALLA